MTIALYKRRWVWLTAGVLVVTAGLAGWLGWRANQSAVVIPQAVIEQVVFTVYQPSRLPAGFALDGHSFTTKDGALLFKVVNVSGQSIIFTEQAVPSGFNFIEFYQQDFAKPVNFQQVPYPSVAGILPNGYHILSVEAKSTWLIMTTKAPVTTADLRLIAENIKPV